VRHWREYRNWRQMRRRARSGGPSVHPRWESFDAFIADLGRAPSPASVLLRLDRSRPWEPGNAAWGSRAEQRRLGRVRLLELHGRRMCVEDWARELSVAPTTLLGRLARGYSDEETLTLPVLSPQQSGARPKRNARPGGV
jgi:hypothetical protein